MEDAPDVDLVFPLDVEDEMGEPGEWPCAQLWEVELVGEAERPDVGLAGVLMEGTLDGVDESASDVVAGVVDVVVDGGPDVVGGEVAEPDRFGHQVVSRLCRGGCEAW